MSDGQLSDPISLPLPTDLLRELEQIAAAAARTRSWIIVRAIRRYLATEGAEIREATAERSAIEAGEGHAMDYVIAEIEEIVRSGKAA